MPTLYRYRNAVLCLDTAMGLTRGNPVGAWAVLDGLRLEYGTTTKVLRQGNGQPTMIGQIHYTNGERAARLNFVTPDKGFDSPGLPALVESLAWDAGEHGAYSLLAEVEESSPAFEALRKAGFSVYAWQRVWKVNEQPGGNRPATVWENATDLDAMPVRALYQSLVPPLVQGADPMLESPLSGVIYEHAGELLAYIEATYGPRGIYLEPLIHPAVVDVLQLVRSYLGGLSFHLGRPIYLSIRSYQAWLENALAELNAEQGVRQALMVKHLVAQQRSPAYATARNGAINSRQPAMIATPGGENSLTITPASAEQEKQPKRRSRH